MEIEIGGRSEKSLGGQESVAVDQECMGSNASSCSFALSFLIRLSFFLPEPVSCRGQRIASSNGKRNRSFTENKTIFAAMVEVLILITMYCNSKHLCAPHGARIHRPKCIRPTEYCQKKNVYHFMENCNASTHQPAHKKIGLTLIKWIDMHFRSIFFSLSTFYTSKPIFIDFVVFLHWTTQQTISASLRFGPTWHVLKKKTRRKAWQLWFAKLVWLAAVQLFHFLSFFFFMLSKQKKKKEEKVQKQFLKRNDQNQCML